MTLSLRRKALWLLFFSGSVSAVSIQRNSKVAPLDLAHNLVNLHSASQEYSTALRAFHEWKIADRQSFQETVAAVKGLLERLSGNAAVSGSIALLGVRDSEGPKKAESIFLTVTDQALQVALIHALRYYHPLFPNADLGEKILLFPPGKMAFEAKLGALEALITVKTDRAAEVCRSVLKSQSAAENLKPYTIVALGIILSGQDKSLRPDEIVYLFSVRSDDIWILDRAFRNWTMALRLFFRDNPAEKHNQQLAAIAGERLAELIKHHGEEIAPIDPNILFEIMQEQFSKAAQLAFERATGEKLLSALDGVDACQVACQLAHRAPEWIRPESLLTPDKGYDGNNDSGWKYALSSLYALFVVKAAPYCSQEVGEASGYYVWLLRQARMASVTPGPLPHSKPGDTLLAFKNAGLASEEVERFLNQFGKEADEVHPSTRNNYNPLTYYGNIFHALFLEEMARNADLRRYVDTSLIESEFREVVGRVYNNLSLFEEGLMSLNGSLWHTYLLALSAVTTDNSGHTANRKAIERLREIRQIWNNPCHFPYKPYRDKTSAAFGFKDDTGAMAPRSVTANLALYLDHGPKSEEQAKQDRDSIIEALSCFQQYGWKSSLQLSAEGYHSNAPSRIGSHFLYPNLPYIVMASKLIAKDPELTDEQKNEVFAIDQFMRRFVLSLQRKDGLFRRMGNRNGFVNSQAHTYPFVGLSLIQYCSSAPEKSVLAVLPRNALSVP